jgi:hypothetical protein
MLSSETNGWRREIIGVDARSGSNPATNVDRESAFFYGDNISWAQIAVKSFSERWNEGARDCKNALPQAPVPCVQ